MAVILNFRIFRKNGNTQKFFNSLTVQDRAISSKFLTHRVSRYSKNQKKKFSPKIEAILNFKFLAKTAKHKIFANSLTVQYKAI